MKKRTIIIQKLNSLISETNNSSKKNILTNRRSRACILY